MSLARTLTRLAHTSRTCLLPSRTLRARTTLATPFTMSPTVARASGNSVNMSITASYHQQRWMSSTRKYTKDHEWVQPHGDELRLGITQYAADELGDVVYVELPDVGDEFSHGDVIASVESVKAAGSVYSPVDLEVTSVNEALVDSPQLVNESPYEDGFVLAGKSSNFDEASGEFMSEEEYQAYLKELEQGE